MINETETPGHDAFSDYDGYNVAGWDGYGAEPVTPETVTAARRFRGLLPHHLRSPDIAPGADGTIGFEWREGHGDRRKIILVDVGPRDVVSARIVHANGRIERFPDTQIGTGARNLISRIL